LKKLLEADRKQWTKSKLPTEVQLAQTPPEQRLVRSIWGLSRQEYGLPVLCIKTPLEKFDPLSKDKQDFESLKLKRLQKTAESESALAGPKDKDIMKTQLVPMQFVAGGASVWVNFGNKDLWEKVAGNLLCFSSVVVAASLLYTFQLRTLQGNMIRTCDDVHNTQCSFFDNVHEGFPIVVRSGAGAWAACAGYVASVLACLCLHVAHKTDSDRIEEEGHSSNPTQGLCKGRCNWLCRYLEATWFHFNMLLNLLCRWPCRVLQTSCLRVDAGTEDEPLVNITEVLLSEVAGAEVP